MKRIILIIMLIWLVSSSVVFAQTANYAYSAVIREATSYVNGCGPDGAPQWVINGLNWISGNIGACNQHDIEYGTLGVPKTEADNNLFNALRLGSWTSVPAVAGSFWAVVRSNGVSAYNDAQYHSKQEFRRIHHGNDWNPSLGRWHPSDGHLRMSFPQ